MGAAAMRPGCCEVEFDRHNADGSDPTLCDEPLKSAGGCIKADFFAEAEEETWNCEAADLGDRLMLRRDAGGASSGAAEKMLRSPSRKVPRLLGREPSAALTGLERLGTAAKDGRFEAAPCDALPLDDDAGVPLPPQRRGSKPVPQHGHWRPAERCGCTVRCPEGHEMRAKLAREMLQLIRCTEEQQCSVCERGLTDHDAYYRCKACDLDLCLSCARQQLGLSAAVPRGSAGAALDLGPGDVLLCGPDRYDIHHVVLIRGGLEAAPECGSVIKVPPGAELLKCQTIESTQGSAGSLTWWYPTTTIILRDPHAGTACVVADWPPGSEDTVFTLPSPVPCKVLLHPLRQELGGQELDHQAFEKALEVCAEESKQYSWNTAVSAFLAYQRSMHVREYPTPEARASLLQKVRKSWEQPPICSAVVIKVWQKYFDMLHSKDPEETVNSILEWMPLWADATTPSAMVKTLTYHGWSLCESLEV